MPNIKISDLHPTGSDLFSDSENYMNELGDSELEILYGGLTTGGLCDAVGKASKAVGKASVAASKATVKASKAVSKVSKGPVSISIQVSTAISEVSIPGI